MRGGAVLLATAALLALAAAPSGAIEARLAPDAAGACPVVPVVPLALPHVADAVAHDREVLVVAFGSSSTAGWRASDIAHSYPAILQHDLNAAFPKAHFAVVNRGVGGQDVAEELPRIDRDVLALHPTLVVWQVGANGAMHNIDVGLFKRLLSVGIRRLIDAEVDVVLMDNQRARAILASPEHVVIDQAMAEVAAATGATLFDRGALMDRWRGAGFPYALFMSDDGIHHNDHGYRCVTDALTDAMVEGLKQTVPARR